MLCFLLSPPPTHLSLRRCSPAQTGTHVSSHLQAPRRALEPAVNIYGGVSASAAASTRQGRGRWGFQGSAAKHSI